ncbi:MAG TPA: hypothetical protein VFF92_04175 [Dehalococcoidales bacterium]|nr:hypothetical protein [Dehalococcoidales bacterium]
MQISRLWGVGLVVGLLVCLLSLAVPASADTLSWSAEPIPGTAGNILGPDGVDIRDMAVASDGTTIYAALGDSLPDNVIFASADAGLTWVALDVPVAADLVAVAPDDAGVVAVARTSPPVVYVTAGDGSAWDSLGVVKAADGAAATAIYDIAVSVGSAGMRYLAASGREAGGAANVWYCDISAEVPAWKETGTLPGFSSASTVRAVAFSPAFPADGVMVAVGETDNVSVNLELFSFSSLAWNLDAGFDGYPLTIVEDDGITDLTSASVSLAPDYLADDAAKRVAFVGLTIEGAPGARAASGIYRLEDTIVEALETGIDIHSVAFDGAGLVAGSYDNNTVYRSPDPLTKTPDVNATSPLKSPGGENKVVVAWAGADAVAGTSGNESAFAVSGESDRAFNDISLIDTSLNRLTDVAVSPDGDRVYLVTDDGEDLSLWCRNASWARVLSRPDTTGYIIRLAPEDAGVVYLAQRGAEAVYWSQDGGETGWLARPCGIEIRDLAVESASVAYVLNIEGEVTGTDDAGRSWGKAEPTGLDDDTGYTLVSAGENNLLAGSTNGLVAYSTDGSSSWSLIPQALPRGSGNVQVIAGADFAANKIIYAASDRPRRGIFRWQIGVSGNWQDIFNNVVTGGIYGLATDGSTLYALEVNPNNNQSTLWQCLSPTTASYASSSWEPRSTTTGTDATDTEVLLGAPPQALKVSSGGKLWAIKTNGTNRLYSITDIMTVLKLDSPEPEFTNPVNTVTGIANEINFIWGRPFTATGYQLYIAYGEDFTQLATTITVPSEQPTVMVPVGPDRDGDARVSFMAGTTYYWRVRVTRPLYHLYSETRSFTVASLTVLPPVIIERPPPAVITIPPSPPVVVPFPEIKIVPPPSPPEPAVPAPSPPEPVVPSLPAALISTAYIWVIIGIGALMVLTVIFLVLMTFVDSFLIWWLQKARYRWSRIRRKWCEAKYLPRALPLVASLVDVGTSLEQVTWTMDGPFHLFDAISYPQTVWARKKDDCDGFAILAAALLKQCEPGSHPVLLTAMFRPMRRSHTVCCFSVPGAGLWFFDNHLLRRGHFREYADVIREIKGEASLVCWDVVDPDTLRTIEFHIV